MNENKTNINCLITIYATFYINKGGKNEKIWYWKNRRKIEKYKDMDLNIINPNDIKDIN